MMRRIFPPLISLGLAFAVPSAHGETESKPATDITAGLKLVDEIDPAKVQPEYESVPGASHAEKILGRDARVMPPAEKARAMAYVIGKGKGLTPGKAYVLTVEYPDDVPRTIFLANRGADYVRGWSTGTAAGDARQQFVEPSVESLNYPQTGRWDVFKQYFHLMDRFTGVKSFRKPEPGHRPYGPQDGFHVVIFQMKQMNDPRSEGAAVGKIRLYEVGDPAKLYAPINYPPDGLPRRRIFWREEMAKEPIRDDSQERGVTNPVDWFTAKMKMAKVLGINTYTWDLLEFGHNQGWESGDQNWFIDAQPPLRNILASLIPAIAAEGFEFLPYYEYKGSIGMAKDSFANQRRALKLYHGKKGEKYTGVSWTEKNNADLTDPETLENAKMVLDKTIVQYKGQVKFPGIWLRTRDNHLPISFSDAAIARFKADRPADAKDVSQDALIASYEGDKALYNKYLDWWFGKRAQFLTGLRDYIREQLGQKDVQVLFTPYPGEAVPVLHREGEVTGQPGVVTDDVAWWKSYANNMQDPWWKWHVVPTDFNTAVEKNLFGAVLKEQAPISANGDEHFHSAPGADPLRYKNIEGVQMTYPIGRLFAVSNPATFEDYRTASGPTVVRFFPLNEDNATSNPMPFDGLLGYLCVDCDRAGPNMMLGQARAVAYAAPRNIAYLSGSSFSTGFPEVMRRFNQAFLAVPALPSKQVEGAASNPEVVVREIPTPKNGTYYYVVNTSMQKLSGIAVKFPAKGTPVNLVTGLKAADKFDLDPAELLAFRVGP